MPENKFPAKDHFELGEARFGKLLVYRIHAFLGDGFIGVIQPSGGFNGKESGGFPTSYMVGSRDVDREADDIVNVKVVRAVGVNRNVDNQLRFFSKRDVAIKEGSWWD